MSFRSFVAHLRKGCTLTYLIGRSRTLRKAVAAFVASELLAELAINATLRGVSASRTGHGGFVGAEQPTNVLAREYCRSRLGESERTTQHRASVLAKGAGLGHRCFPFHYKM